MPQILETSEIQIDVRKEVKQVKTGQAATK